ncbi:MAG: hypothetical protein KAI22_04805 [Gammaproteobacteria bacterium]|nr:hypothetical protein [Gammaproteobacteria bacterium]
MLKIFVNHFKTIHFQETAVILFFMTFLLTLSGCSPHPGAGKWQADGKNSHHIATINIIFQGTADFYTDGKEESIRRCFWSAAGEHTMQMQCVHSDNSDKKVTYEFMVTEKGHAKLSQNEQLIGQFTLQAPEKEASFW